MVYYVLLFLLGAIVGAALTFLWSFWVTIRGTLLVDHKHGRFLFKLDDEPDTLPKYKRVSFKVDNNADLSQK